MEKTFQVKMPNGKIQEVSETMARNLGRQVQVIGEVVDSKYRKRGGENTMTEKEFRDKHIHQEETPSGKKVRRIDKGFERVAEVDESSRPGGSQVGSDGVLRNRTVREKGREISRAEWERRQKGQ